MAHASCRQHSSICAARERFFVAWKAGAAVADRGMWHSGVRGIIHSGVCCLVALSAGLRVACCIGRKGSWQSVLVCRSNPSPA